MKTAKLFQNGQSQAVRLPKEFRFEGSRVYVQRVGSAVVLLPYADPWDALFESLDEFSRDFSGQSSAPPTSGTKSALPATIVGGTDA